MFFAATMIDSKPVYNVVQEVDKDANPKALGYFERKDNSYFPTEDTKRKEKIYFTEEIDPNPKERKIIFNTEDIKYMLDHPLNPNATWVFTRDGKPALIKGTFEENSKILLGFNRK